MIRLASTDLLSLTTAQNGAEVIASYNDRTTTAYGPGNTQLTDISSATTTTILSSPAASTVREPDEISIKNTFAGSHTMTLNFNRSATLYVMWTVTLETNERIEYTHATGWRSMDANGAIKTVLGATGQFTTLTVSGNTTLGDAAADSVTINAGIFSQPNIPCFLAYNTTSPTNVTGNGATYTVIFDTEVFDQGSNFNNTTSTFTAPQTGKYDLRAQVVLSDITALMTGQTLNIITSNRTIPCAPTLTPVASGRVALSIAVIVDMDVNDTATVTVRVTSGAGDTADILGDASLLYTYFCGKLVA